MTHAAVRVRSDARDSRHTHLTARGRGVSHRGRATACSSRALWNNSEAQLLRRKRDDRAMTVALWLCLTVSAAAATPAIINLEQLEAELARQARRMQTVDCAAEPEAACIAEPGCEPEPGMCQPTGTPLPSPAECVARVTAEPAAVEPTLCEPSPTTGCAWTVTPATSAWCEPTTETAEHCSGRVADEPEAAEPAVCEPASGSGCVWSAAEPEAASCEPAVPAAGAVCEPLAEPECDGNPGCSYSVYPGCAPRAEPEAESEPETEPAVEPVNEPAVEPAAGFAGAEPEAEPELVKVLLWAPTFLMLALFGAGILAYSSRGKRLESSDSPPAEWFDSDQKPGTVSEGWWQLYQLHRDTPTEALRNEDGELNPAGRLVKALQDHHSSVYPMIKMVAPAVTSAIVAPALMTWRDKLLAFVFSEHETIPNMNDAISCFLTPAGMIYAIFFGFVFSAVGDRVTELDRLVSEESSGIVTIMRVTFAMPERIFPQELKCRIVEHCREALVGMVEDLYGEGGKIYDTGNAPMLPGIQAILPELHNVVEHVDLDSSSGKPALYSIKKIHEIVTSSGPLRVIRRKTMRHRLSFQEWLFLQVLACFTFFGMMLVDCQQSFSMNLVVCFVTATTIIVLMLFVADMDDIERGYFTVDTHGLCEALYLAEVHISQYSGKTNLLNSRSFGRLDLDTVTPNPILAEE